MNYKYFDMKAFERHDTIQEPSRAQFTTNKAQNRARITKTKLGKGLKYHKQSSSEELRRALRSLPAKLRRALRLLPAKLRTGLKLPQNKAHNRTQITANKGLNRAFEHQVEEVGGRLEASPEEAEELHARQRRCVLAGSALAAPNQLPKKILPGLLTISVMLLHAPPHRARLPPPPPPRFLRLRAVEPGLGFRVEG